MVWGFNSETVFYPSVLIPGIWAATSFGVGELLTVPSGFGTGKTALGFPRSFWHPAFSLSVHLRCPAESSWARVNSLIHRVSYRVTFRIPGWACPSSCMRFWYLPVLPRFRANENVTGDLRAPPKRVNHGVSYWLVHARGQA